MGHESSMGMTWLVNRMFRGKDYNALCGGLRRLGAGRRGGQSVLVAQ